MSKKRRQTTGRKPKDKIKNSDVQGRRALEAVMGLLAELRDHADDPKRKLHYDEYCAWLLLYFFTPVVDSMRGLQQASDIPAVRKRMRLPRFSLGSFSEAGGIFDAALLEPIIEELSQALQDVQDDPRLTKLGQRPVAVDGTLVRALPKMVWALWRDEDERAARVHLHLDLLRGMPEHADVTDARASEIDQLAASLQAGRLYITDRGYFSFALMAAILGCKSSFVGRVRENIVYETLEERPVSAHDKNKGVVADRIVRAGGQPDSNPVQQPLRLVEIHVKNSAPPRVARVDRKSKAYRTRETDHTVLLLTDRLDLPVETIAVLYRYRWQVEIFFRWFKKVLQADRLLSLSENGLTIVTYCALIASMLISLWVGRKPTKRTWEMLCFYFYGMATEEDLARHVARLEAIDKTR